MPGAEYTTKEPYSWKSNMQKRNNMVNNDDVNKMHIEMKWRRRDSKHNFLVLVIPRLQRIIISDKEIRPLPMSTVSLIL